MAANMKEELQKVAYTTYAKQFNLKPEWLGKTFEDGGRKYTIVGLNINSKKFPVVTKQGISFNGDYLRALMTNDLETYEKEYEERNKKKVQQRLRKARQTYLKHGYINSLKKQWLDKSFDGGRYTFTIVGLEFGRTRTKVLIQRSDNGRIYFTSVDYIVKQLGGKKKKKEAA